MNEKICFALTIGLLAAACGGGDRVRPDQQQYETVEEGSAAGVTATIAGPGETLPPLTGTNADTTTAFDLDTNALPTSQPGATDWNSDPAATTTATWTPPTTTPARTPAPTPTPTPARTTTQETTTRRPAPAPRPVEPAPRPEPEPTEPPPPPTETAPPSTTSPAPPPTSTSTSPPPPPTTSPDTDPEEPPGQPKEEVDADSLDHEDREGLEQIVALFPR